MKYIFLILLNYFIINSFALHNFDFMKSSFMNNHFLSDSFKSILKTQNNVWDDSKCTEDLEKLSLAIKAKEMWAISLFDSWGKIPSGVLRGHLMELGNYDECLNITSSSDNGVFNTQYCLAKIPLDDLMQALKPVENNKQVKAAQQIGGIDERLSIGICVPSTCSPPFLEKRAKDILKIIEDNAPFNISFKSLKIPEETCSQKEKIEFEAIDIVAITFFSVIGATMFLSTIYDYLIQKYNKKAVNILIAFSVLTNGKKLFKIPDSSQKSADIVNCLHGIRCLSIIWVVFGHTYVMFGMSPLNNSIDIKEWFTSPYSMFLLSGTISVDTFFFLSGFLVAWVAFKEMEKSAGKLNVFLMYFHRYIRLTPVVAVVILFTVSLMRYIGDGPFHKSYMTGSSDLCESNWWSTLLYVQNYVHGSKMCLGHTWYLAVDTQLYVLSPLLLFPTYYFGYLFLLPSALILALVSVGLTFWNVITYEFGIGLLNRGPNENLRMEKIYYVTHCRAAPWLVGFVLGYFMLRTRKIKFSIPKIFMLLGWLMSFAIILTVIFAIFPKTKQIDRAPSNLVENAFYESLIRVTWSIGVAWIVFACQNGYGGFINSFLSYPLWQVLGRLTYSIYIIHMVVEVIRGGMVRTVSHFSDYETMNMFWGDFGFTLLVSILVVLAFESPIIGIEKAIFGKTSQKKPSVAETNGENFSKNIDKFHRI